MMIRTWPLALLALTFGGAARADEKLAARTAAALYEGLSTEELSNGLRVYLKPVPGSTSVTTMVVYKVGSADEDKSFTGLAHYLEHLLFKGTSKLKPGDIDRITFRAGGSNNAYTSADVTAYHFTLPASRWKDALQVEADRMRNVVIDKEHEFDKEKGAVINELAMYEDTPWDLENKAILPRLFGKAHPYGHPVIGETPHVKAATEKVIKGFYDRWYHPNNASLVIVGGFDPAEALAAVKKLFGPIPRGELPARKPVPAEAPRLPSRHEMESKFSVPRLLVGFPTVKAGDDDQPALAVLEGVLAAGKRSRLYHALVEGAAVAATVGADHSPGRYPGWMSVYMEVLPGKDRAAAEKLLLAELAKLRDQPVPADELSRAQRQIVAASIFGQESTYGLANRIGQAVTLTSLEFARGYLPRVAAVTPRDVQRVARKYLVPERSATVWSVPPEKAGRPSEPRPSGSGGRLNRAVAVAEGAFDLKKARRVELPNGLILLLFESKRLPIFEAHVVLREAGLYQPDDKLGVARLTGLMLDEGTATKTGPEIAEMIEAVGGQLSLSTGGTVKVLSPHRKMALGLLLECLTKPAFRQDAFDRAKQRLLAEIGENEVLPEARALRAFRQQVYGKHPLGRPLGGTMKTASSLTPDDCRDFHRRVFVPNNTIVAVAGDFDADEVIAEVKALVADWKRAELPNVARPKVELPAKFTQTILSMPQAAQLQVYLGHVGIRRDDPDFYKLLVMDYILGTGPGFTDRMSARLRDREGLAYTVSARITGTAGLEPGAFTCYIGTDTDKLDVVRKLFLEELNRIRNERPTAEEVADARTYLIGSRQLQFATAGGIAEQLAAIERFGLGFDYLEKFEKAVAAVTADDVQAVAKKHLHPDRMVLVAAGAIGKDGKPLPAK
jgi:zinc protease